MISPSGQYHMGCKKTTIQGVKNIPYIWYKAAKRMVCMMDNVCVSYIKGVIDIDQLKKSLSILLLNNYKEVVSILKGIGFD